MKGLVHPGLAQSAPPRGAARKAEEQPCHWENDREIGRWFLPGCMGGAVYGESQCTCRRTRRMSLEARLDRLERKLDDLSDSLLGAANGDSGLNTSKLLGE